MATNLLEAYKGRLAVADKVYSESHNGEKLSNAKKLLVANCLKNVNAFLNEAFENSVGTQRADLGAWKKFALNLTTVALPNLIAPELVIVYPMPAYSGYITYLEYTAGSNKGQTKQGDVFNSVFGLGKVDVNYTGAHVNETHKATAAEVAAHKFSVKWTPVAVVEGLKIGDTDYQILTDATQTPVADTSVLMNADGSLTFADGDTKFIADAEISILYVYDNVVIPQNDLPILNVEPKGIALQAKARRIAIYFSQMAAFQAKTDYGFNMQDQLAEKAVGQLSYEIDTEVCQLLVDTAVANTPAGTNPLDWSRTIPVGVSKPDHYQGFAEVVEIGRQIIYDRTRRFAPNYMLIASNILPILTFVKGFVAAPAGEVNGPYFAGTLNGLKVFVTPSIEPGRFVIGVNGNDAMSSAAVYAPYMPIVPTQLLQYADGGTSQGWSTLYDLKVLNKDLLVTGKVTDGDRVSGEIVRTRQA